MNPSTCLGLQYNILIFAGVGVDFWILFFDMLYWNGPTMGYKILETKIKTNSWGWVGGGAVYVDVLHKLWRTNPDLDGTCSTIPQRRLALRRQKTCNYKTGF